LFLLWLLTALATKSRHETPPKNPLLPLRSRLSTMSAVTHYRVTQ